jgi:uncharacterized protein with HEPN domain
MDVEQLGRLRDILEAARLIARYVSDTTEAAFRADRQKQDAVIRRIEIIGEAAAHLSEATRQAAAVGHGRIHLYRRLRNDRVFPP